jgi:hypothetical protein
MVSFKLILSLVLCIFISSIDTIVNFEFLSGRNSFIVDRCGPPCTLINDKECPGSSIVDDCIDGGYENEIASFGVRIMVLNVTFSHI